jgi:hypothetical protein
MKKNIYFLIASLIFINIYTVKPQNLEIFFTDVSDYPIMTTSFRLFDQDSNEIRESISASDIIIEETENSQLVVRNILDVDCPNSVQTTYSVIFTVDLSTSMADPISDSITKLGALKTVLLECIDDFDTKRAEIAIIGFCADVIPNKNNPDEPIHPFSTDKESLKKEINIFDNYLCPGTNYNAAFFHARGNPSKTNLSALHFCKPDVRKYKPVIVFLTDGNHLPEWGGPFKLGEVVVLAEERNATIYVIKIGNDELTQENQYTLNALAQIGKSSADKTPNIWMNVNNADELQNIYNEILEEAGTIGDPPPCYVTWKTACEGGSASFTFPNHSNLSGISDYIVEPDKKPEVIFNPVKLTINSIEPGDFRTVDITILAKNNYAEITGMGFLKDINALGRFTVSDWGTDAPLPITIPEDSSYKITVKYQPVDTSKTEAIMAFTGFACSGEFVFYGNPSPVSVKERKKLFLNDLKIYPNPADGQIKLSVSYPFNDILDFDIYNYIGNLINSFFLENEQITKTIYISDLIPGSYFIRCRQTGQIIPFAVIR